MDKTLDLPYTKSPFDEKFKEESKKYFKYLRNIFTPYFKKQLKKSKNIKIDNFLYPNPGYHIETIKNIKQNLGYAKNPRFLYFDVKKFYPTVDHQKLKSLILMHYLYSRNCRKLDEKTLEELQQHKKVSRYFKDFLKYLEVYFSYSNFKWKWLLSSNPVTFILAEIYLFELFIDAWTNIIRWNDDFVLLSRKKDDMDMIFKTFIVPNMEKLDLKINIDKLVTGNLFFEDFSYIWFTFKKWWVVIIQEKRIIEYLEKVKHIFYKKVNESLKNKIKKLRNLQFWFFYYYRICSLKYIWEKLNSKTRDIVRSYLLTYKQEWKIRFFVKNESLYKMWVINFLDLKF